MTTIKDISS